jgi:hypothetical protein
MTGAAYTIPVLTLQGFIQVLSEIQAVQCIQIILTEIEFAATHVPTLKVKHLISLDIPSRGVHKSFMPAIPKAFAIDFKKLFKFERIFRAEDSTASDMDV